MKKALFASIIVVSWIHAKLARADIVSVPKEVVLEAITTENLENKPLTSAYNFHTMSTPTTTDDYDLQFWSINGETLSGYGLKGSVSVIYDLGERGCQTISSVYREGQDTNPLRWLSYSSADPNNFTPMNSAPAKERHCYLLAKIAEDHTLVVLFNVFNIVPGKSLSLGQIEVLVNR